MRTRLGLLLVLVSLALVPVAALAKDGRPEVRTSVSCGSGVTAALRLRAQGGQIRARFEVGSSRAGLWHIVFVHERRVAWRGSATSSFEVERSLPDFPGSDAVSARATGPRGVVCQVAGVLPEVSLADNEAQGGHG
ncbi:MAG: hypothetical protein QOH15_2385 [Gaiellales bacterium]|nr:hypothetical protein [Gaiellales bacterium]